MPAVPVTEGNHFEEKNGPFSFGHLKSFIAIV